MALVVSDIMANFGKLTVRQANDLISELESSKYREVVLVGIEMFSATFSSLRRFFYSVERNFDGCIFILSGLSRTISDFASTEIFHALQSVKLAHLMPFGLH